jgi:hypothetical protein
MALRDIKHYAREALHRAFQVRALYVVEGEDPVICYVRVHTKNDALGDMRGTSLGYAEHQEVVPKVIFWREELNPDNGAIVVVSADEAYRVDNVVPRDGDTVTAEVVSLSATQRAGLPVPQDVPE